MECKSYRKIIKAMDTGKIPRRHLGPKNFHILRQELLSLKNQYKPKSFTSIELEEIDGIIRDRVEEIEQLSSREQFRLIKIVDSMLCKK